MQRFLKNNNDLFQSFSLPLFLLSFVCVSVNCMTKKERSPDKKKNFPSFVFPHFFFFLEFEIALSIFKTKKFPGTNRWNNDQ